MDCPKCEGPMWDNRDSKRNPKAPDYKCKDKENCDGAVWLDKKKPGNGAASNGNGASKPAPINNKLDAKTYMARAALVMKTSHTLMKEAFGESYDHEDARSLFIQAGKDGLIRQMALAVTDSKPAAAKPAPPTRRPEPEPETAAVSENEEGLDL